MAQATALGLNSFVLFTAILYHRPTMNVTAFFYCLSVTIFGCSLQIMSSAFWHDGMSILDLLKKILRNRELTKTDQWNAPWYNYWLFIGFSYYYMNQDRETKHSKWSSMSCRFQSKPLNIWCCLHFCPFGHTWHWHKKLFGKLQTMHPMMHLDVFFYFSK